MRKNEKLQNFCKLRSNAKRGGGGREGGGRGESGHLKARDEGIRSRFSEQLSNEKNKRQKALYLGGLCTENDQGINRRKIGVMPSVFVKV